MQYRLEQIVSPRSAIYRQIYQYYNYCEHVRNMSQASLTSKIYVINNFLLTSDLSNLRKITNQMIFDWISAQQTRGNTGRSINNRLAHLKAMLHWQQQMNLIMPKLKLSLITRVNEQPPRKVIFTREEIARVLLQSNQIEWLLIHLAFDCGLRISEIKNLQLKHLRADQITVVGKGKKRRYAYICPVVKRRLEAWICQHKIQKYLWPSQMYPDLPLSTCTLRSYMQQAFRRCGYEDFCPHDLRHSYATDLKLLGVPTRQIQAGLGHATEAVTEKYLSDLDGFDPRNIYQVKYSL